MLGFSISAYLIAPVSRCGGSLESAGVGCGARWSAAALLGEPVRGSPFAASLALPSFTPHLTLSRLAELGGLELPKKDRPVDLGAVALQIAGALKLKWAVAGMLKAKPVMAAATETPHGISVHPAFGTVQGGVTGGVLGEF